MGACCRRDEGKGAKHQLCVASSRFWAGGGIVWACGEPRKRDIEWVRGPLVASRDQWRSPSKG